MTSEQETVVAKKKRVALAKERWKLLARVLQGESTSLIRLSSASVRRFQSFGLLKTKVISELSALEPSWIEYSCPEIDGFLMKIRHLPDTIKPNAVFGFNNTGNVCVWPSEEVLAYYCYKYLKEKFCGRKILELGGGMTCLAGVMAGILSEAKEIVLTDGNEESVENLKAIITDRENEEKFGNTDMSARVMRWGCEKYAEDVKEYFDFIICADCLFFKEGREDLVILTYKLLKPQGTVFMIAPKRGDTFDEFLQLADSKFKTKVESHYDSIVWDIHTKMKAKGLDHYDEDIHYPLLLTMEKKGK